MKLGLMYTGGTIGCFYKPLRPMKTDEFSALFDEQALPILRSRFPSLSIEYIPFGPPALDSTNVKPADWCKIISRILPLYDKLDAFLVLHGTDTMSYSAAALSFLFTGLDDQGHRNAILNKPVILTGSQVPLFDGDSPPTTAKMRFNTDAFQNLCGAISCAYYGIPKVCLFFHHKLFLGTRTQKTSSNQFDAFSSPNYPPLAQVGIETTLNHGNIRQNFPNRQKLLSNPQARERLQAQLEFIKSLGNEIRISAFEAYPTNPEHLAGQLRSLLHLGDPQKQLDGLILEAYGAGNFPSGSPKDPTQGEVYQVLAEATAKGVIIVNNTSCLSGIVDSSTYESGSWLQRVKAVSAYDLTPVALYTKLLFLLALAKRHDWNDEKVRMLLTTNYTGEMLDVHCLDTFGQRELWPGESISSRDGTARLTNDLFRGPQLRLRTPQGGWSDPVWSAVGPEVNIGLTCILRMQSDGNLVFRSNTLEILWESGTAKDVTREEPYSRLELRGLDHPTGVSLRVFNYVANVTSKVLYPAEEATIRS